VASLHNRKITPAEQTDIKSRFPKICERYRETATYFIDNIDPRKMLEVSAEKREAFRKNFMASRASAFGLSFLRHAGE